MSSYLLTGGTGVIGSALVPVLLEDPATRVTLIVRARDEAHLGERKRGLLSYWGLQPEDEARLRFLAGDVVAPRMGLSGKDYDLLTSEVTNVIHCAGNVNLKQPLEVARGNACGGVTTVLDFSQRALISGNLRKVDVTSTVGVAGRMEGIVEERRFTEPRRFRNTYEAAKAEAENLLWDAIDRGVPVTIHRPSMVVGDSRTGKVSRFQVFYYLADFLSGARTKGILPALGEKALDIIPVDVVSRAIALSANDDATAGSVFHLCSGPEKMLLLAELSTRVRAELVAHGHRVPRLRYVSPRVAGALARAASACTRGAFQKRISTLPHFLSYLREDQAFSALQTRNLLYGQGSEVPTPQSYLTPVLHHFNAFGTQRVCDERHDQQKTPDP